MHMSYIKIDGVDHPLRYPIMYFGRKERTISFFLDNNKELLIRCLINVKLGGKANGHKGGKSTHTHTIHYQILIQCLFFFFFFDLATLLLKLLDCI